MLNIFYTKLCLIGSISLVSEYANFALEILAENKLNRQHWLQMWQQRKLQLQRRVPSDQTRCKFYLFSVYFFLFFHNPLLFLHRITKCLIAAHTHSYTHTHRCRLLTVMGIIIIIIIFIDIYQVCQQLQRRRALQRGRCAAALQLSDAATPRRTAIWAVVSAAL